MSQRVSPTVERRLLTAVERVADHVQSGLEPSSAVVKTARDMGLRRGETELVLRAFNTGRVNHQRSSQSDVLIKAAAIPLADWDEVRSELYPDTVKTASAQRRETAVSAEYDLPPRSLRQKAAGALLPWPPPDKLPAASAPPAPEKQAWDACRQMLDLRRKQAQVQTEEYTAAWAVEQTLHKLAAELGRYESPPLDAAQELGELLHGPVGRELLDLAARLSPGVTKLAQHRRSVPLSDIDATGPVFRLLTQAVEQLETLSTKQAATRLAGDEYAAACPELVTAYSATDCRSILDDPKDVLRKSAATPGPLTLAGAYKLMEASGQLIPRAPADSDIASVLRKLDDPMHEEQLRHLSAQNTLQGLALDDPVISGYPPAAIAQAYNNIVQVAPSAAGQQLLLQSMMRKALQQGQLDTFEVGSLLDMERQMQQRDQPSIKGVASDGTVL